MPLQHLLHPRSGLRDGIMHALDADFEPLRNKAQDALVRNTVLEETDDPRVGHGIVKAPDIRIEHPVHLASVRSPPLGMTETDIAAYPGKTLSRHSLENALRFAAKRRTLCLVPSRRHARSMPSPCRRAVDRLRFGCKCPPKPWCKPEGLPELSREMSLVGETSGCGDFSEPHARIAHHLPRPLQATHE